MDALHTHPTAPSSARQPAPVRASALAPRRRLAIHPLAIILLLSLAVRVALWTWLVAGADRSALLADDAGTYHLSAAALLQTGTFSVQPGPVLVPQTTRTPGYPVFLAAVYAVFGQTPAAAVLVQAILGVGTIALVYVLARRLWGERVALLAAGLLALAMGPLQLSLLLMSETLFTLLLVCALACGVALLTRPERRRWAMAMGIAFAACSFVRPAAYYLVLPVALGLAIHGWRARWGMREIAWVMAMLLVPYAVAVGAWQLRNLRLTGSAAFSQVGAEVLLRYRGAAVVAARDGISLDQARARLAAEYPVDPNRPPTPAENARWRRAGIALIRDHPGIYARVMAAGALRPLVLPAGLSPPTPNPPPEPGWRAEVRERGVWGALRSRTERRGLLHSATFALDALRLAIVLAAAGWFVAELVIRRRMEVVDAFLLGVAAYLLLVHAGPTSGVRTRVQLEPVLALYAARGLAALRPGTRRPGVA